MQSLTYKCPFVPVPCLFLPFRLSWPGRRDRCPQHARWSSPWSRWCNCHIRIFLGKRWYHVLLRYSTSKCEASVLGYNLSQADIKQAFIYQSRADIYKGRVYINLTRFIYIYIHMRRWRRWLLRKKNDVNQENYFGHFWGAICNNSVRLRSWLWFLSKQQSKAYPPVDYPRMLMTNHLRPMVFSGSLS